MPMVNYCRKCKAEVPLGESCAYCGAHLTQAGEQLSFGLVRLPVKDWFAWNNLLRIALPVWALIWAIVLAAELAAGGPAAAAALWAHGFADAMLGLLGGMLLLIWALLAAQGREKVHVVLDRQGIHVRTYLAQGSRVPVYARFTTPQAAEALEQSDDRPPLEGLMLVRRVTVPWAAVRRVRMWREGCTLLFFRPAFWQCCAVRCPIADWPEAEAFVRKKLKRVPKVRILPPEKAEKKKKR